MKAMLDHIERVKRQPHHIRKQVAFLAAGAITAVIALLWLGGSLATGAFALKETSFADSAASVAPAISGESAASAVAGAAAAQSAGAPPKIEIIDATPAATKKAEQTTIPF